MSTPSAWSVAAWAAIICSACAGVIVEATLDAEGSRPTRRKRWTVPPSSSVEISSGILPARLNARSWAPVAPAGHVISSAPPTPQEAYCFAAVAS
jgi:hypothetical protein